jgi:hypothetical protein
MVNKLLQILAIRCSHKKISQPFAASVSVPRTGSGWDTPAPATRHYVVCLECGHKMEYDWTRMRVVGK